LTIDPTDRIEAFSVTMSASVSGGGDRGREGFVVPDDVFIGFGVPDDVLAGPGVLDETLAAASTMEEVPCRGC